MALHSILSVISALCAAFANHAVLNARVHSFKDGVFIISMVAPGATYFKGVNDEPFAGLVFSHVNTLSQKHGLRRCNYLRNSMDSLAKSGSGMSPALTARGREKADPLRLIPVLSRHQPEQECPRLSMGTCFHSNAQDTARPHRPASHPKQRLRAGRNIGLEGKPWGVGEGWPGMRGVVVEKAGGLKKMEGDARSHVRTGVARETGAYRWTRSMASASG